MPSIRLSNVAAGTANAVDGLQFQDIPEPGALVTIYGPSGVPEGKSLLGTFPLLVAMFLALCFGYMGRH